MLAHRRSKPFQPPRVRHEPPTIFEAFAAARDLTDDPERMVEIAAGLMGISADEARPHLASFAGRKSSMGNVRSIGGPTRRTVVVERRRRIGAA